MHIVIEPDLTTLCADTWNQLVPDNHPFLQHEFLAGLEATQCVNPKTGWTPQHILVYTDTSKTTLCGAMPCYLKQHSYGEYIFDWVWADAYQRAGLNYYPKLLCAIPFTPVTGPRCLVAQNADKLYIQRAISQHLLKSAQEHNVSSIHCLFTNAETNQLLENDGFVKRVSSQFHWTNSGYQSFDDFLNQLSSKKRKNIKRERRRVTEADIEYVWHHGDSLTPEAMLQMNRFYERTIRRYGAQQYLSRDFFMHLQQNMPHHTHVLLAYHQQQAIAGGLYFSSDHCLYGRYWGALDDFHSLHFETCYYQPIQYCIERQLQLFEAGAQGEHKLARGLLPQTTYSMHWLADPQFRDAVINYTHEEAAQIDRYNELLTEHSPFREI